MTLRVEVARTFEDAERLAWLWDQIPWGREEAERDYLLARTRLRPAAVAPFALFVLDGDRPVAAAAGRLEYRRLGATVGYRTVYAPQARVLQVVDGGIFSTDPVPGLLVETLRAALTSGDVDAIAVPPLEVGGPLHAELARLGGALEREPFTRPWPRRLLELPATFEDFAASRSRKLRFGIRYDAKRLLEALGGNVSVDITRDPQALARFTESAEAIAATSYQRSVGGGFADTEEQRELLGLALERGWARGYVLRHDGLAVAYWLCSTYRGTITLRTTGYLPEYARHRPGIYLLMRVIEDACTDPDLRILDFGPGDAAYKQHFSSESQLEENALFFAPSLRGRRINLTRGAVIGAARIARVVVDSAGVTARLRKGWRKRLRRPA